MGRPREILKPTREGNNTLVHPSVRTRLEGKDSETEAGEYVPRAKFDRQEVEWVD